MPCLSCQCIVTIVWIKVLQISSSYDLLCDVVIGAFLFFSLSLCSPSFIVYCSSISYFGFMANYPCNALCVFFYYLYFSVFPKDIIWKIVNITYHIGLSFIGFKRTCFFSSFTYSSKFSRNNASWWISSLFSTFLRYSINMSLFKPLNLWPYQA